MAKLILKEFRCVEDTDEVGAESPYFLVFIGDLETGKTELKMIRQGNWHNEVDKGELWTVNAPVTNGFSFKPNPTLVLVAMVEEDENVDVSAFERDNIIKPLLAAKFKSFRDSGATIVTNAIASGVIDTFNIFLNVSLSNDDNMGIKRLKTTGQTGDQPLLNYFADTGHYRVRFTIQ
jgi:hypothetical protein